MHRSFVLLVALGALVTASPPSFALTIDAKALARYDASYVVCESAFPEMRGHRDEAYMGLWRVKADAASRAQLAAVRKSKAYLDERAVVAKSSPRTASSSASSPIKQECQVLWGEAQKYMKIKS